MKIFAVSNEGVLQFLWLVAIFALVAIALKMIFKAKFAGTPTSSKEKSVFRVGGMHCENCKNRLERALKSVPEIRSAVAEPHKNLLVVKGAGVPEAKIREIVESLGFAFLGKI